jgi:hypothetical protein
LVFDLVKTVCLVLRWVALAFLSEEKSIMWMMDYKDLWTLEAVFGLVEGHLH